MPLTVALVFCQCDELSCLLPFSTAANPTCLPPQKLWAVCDLAMGLLLTKTTNFEMREFPSEPRIPPMYFRKPADPNFVNGEHAPRSGPGGGEGGR